MKIKLGKTTAIGRKTAEPAKKSGKTWVLRLYVAGKLPRAVSAINNLKVICEEQLKGRYIIEVVDLAKHPHFAHDDQILAVPTLVRKSPLPERNVIGDLSNTARVLAGLDLAEL